MALATTIQQVYDTITTQADMLLGFYKEDPTTTRRLESLVSLIENNMQLLMDAAEDTIAEVDAMQRKLQVAKLELTDLQSCKDLLATSESTIQKLQTSNKKYQAEIDQLKISQNNLMVQNRDLNKTISSHNMAKEAKKKIKDSTADLEKQLATAKQETETFKRRLGKLCGASKKATQLLNLMRTSMIYEGLAVDRTIKVNGHAYHIYKRPGLCADWQPHFKPTLSVAHNYWIRVETDEGYHLDVFPTLDGKLTVGSPKALPKVVKDMLLEDFKETQFTNNELLMRNTQFNDQLKEVVEVIEEMSAFDKD